jgi:hypothetical protein
MLQTSLQDASLQLAANDDSSAGVGTMDTIDTDVNLS